MNVQHFRLLFYFVEVAKAGSIRGAASRLGLSASVISASLSGLEDVLGVSLLRRSTRHMELTPDGLKYLEKAVIAIDAFADVFEDLNTPAQETEGRVLISLPTELAAVWVPTVIAQFKKEFPKIEVLVHADDAKINVKTSEHDIAVRTEFRKSPRLGKNGNRCISA